MTFDIIRKNFADYISKSQIKIDITGFDLDGFAKVVTHIFKDQLENIEYIVFEDDDILSNDEKVEAIQELFRQSSQLYG